MDSDFSYFEQTNMRDGIYCLIDEFDDRLHSDSDDFNFADPPCDPIQLYKDLRDCMCDKKGIGLAAPQVGINLNVFVMGNPETPEEVMAVFNPLITNYSDEVVIGQEGCLSYPDLFIKIKRASSIRCRYSGVDGVSDAINFSGMTARVFQHEYDHLRGTTMLDIASPIWKDKAKKWKKQQDRKKRRGSKSNGR